MRRIGTLTDPQQARRFADYLCTLSIQCHVDIDDASSMTESENPNSGASPAAEPDSAEPQCDLWIRDEADVERARQELQAFQAAPDDDKYQVGGQAEQIRKQKVADEKRKKKLQQKVNHKSPSGGAGMLMGVPIRQESIPVVIATIILSVIATFATGAGQPDPSKIPGELSSGEMLIKKMSFVDKLDYYVDEDPYASIKKGEVWRLVTPLFLHGHMFHLAFNMIGIFFLGSVIERLQGSLFMAMLLLVCGVFGTLFNVSLPPASALPPLLSGLAGSPFLIGASGAVYGLFGYLWIRPLLSPNYPVRMMPSNVGIMLGAMVMMVFFVDGIAHGAHIGGLIAGVVIAAISSRISIDAFS